MGDDAMDYLHILEAGAAPNWYVVWVWWTEVCVSDDATLMTTVSDLQAVAVSLIILACWSAFLYRKLVNEEESGDLHLHIVQQGGESGVRQRLVTLEQELKLEASRRYQRLLETEAPPDETLLGALEDSLSRSGSKLTQRQRTFVEEHQRDEDGSGGDDKEHRQHTSPASGLDRHSHQEEDGIERRKKIRPGSLTKNWKAESEARRKEFAKRNIPLRTRRPDPPAPVLESDEVTR